MRTVENRESHNRKLYESDSRKRPRREEAEKMIIEMLDTDISPELIQEIMDDRRVPSSFVKRTIEEYLKNK